SERQGCLFPEFVDRGAEQVLPVAVGLIGQFGAELQDGVHDAEDRTDCMLPGYFGGDGEKFQDEAGDRDA
ncbi:MAG: hypothetical protein M3Y49_11725, partial [Actinomycetota bacterium]|nr:hypothetical protein [Actinomycetota bacterium]